MHQTYSKLHDQYPGQATRVRFAYGDPDELDRLAHKLRSCAADVRARADDQVRRSASAKWVSDAAEAYRNELAGRRVKADRAAGDLEQAAAALEAHAQEVRDRLARIARIEQEVSDWFSRKSLVNKGFRFVGGGRGGGS